MMGSASCRCKEENKEAASSMSECQISLQPQEAGDSTGDPCHFHSSYQNILRVMICLGRELDCQGLHTIYIYL